MGRDRKAGFFSFFVHEKRVLHLFVSPYKIGTDMYEKWVTAGKEIHEPYEKRITGSQLRHQCE